MTDVYAEMGEFHDLFMTEPWERLRPHLREELGHLGPDEVVVDVGAGTGMGTRVLAQETSARISALEPSLLMRAVLTARVADSPEMVERVSVLAGGIPDGLADLPTPVAGAVCAHMLGGIDRELRGQLFAWLAQNLTPEGRVVVTVHEPGPTTADETAEIVESRVIGDLEYRVVYEHTAGVTFSSRYEVWRDDRRLRDLTFVGGWTPVTLADVAMEAGEHGLVVDRIGRGVASLRPA